MDRGARWWLDVWRKFPRTATRMLKSLSLSLVISRNRNLTHNVVDSLDILVFGFAIAISIQSPMNIMLMVWFVRPRFFCAHAFSDFLAVYKTLGLTQSPSHWCLFSSHSVGQALCRTVWRGLLCCRLTDARALSTMARQMSPTVGTSTLYLLALLAV